jgi:hypothetical protein
MDLYVAVPPFYDPEIPIDSVCMCLLFFVIYLICKSCCCIAIKIFVKGNDAALTYIANCPQSHRTLMTLQERTAKRLRFLRKRGTCYVSFKEALG